jgi:sarcosine oxidase subunit beta
MTTNAPRICVIGGGIYGSAVTYFLEKFGATNVVLIEKENLGGLATSRSAGLVRHHYSHDHHIALCKRGREILEQFPTFTGRDGGWHQNGCLLLAGSEYERAFREIVKLERELSLDVDLLGPDDLQGYLFGLNTTDVSIGSLERQAGFAYPYQIAVGLAKKAEEMGATIRTDTPVADIHVDQGAVESVETVASTMPVDFVVNASGHQAGKVASMANVEIPLRWYEDKVAILRGDSTYSADMPSVIFVDDGLYCMPERGDMLIGGFSDPEIQDPTLHEGITQDDLLELDDKVGERFPEFDNARFIDGWSETITATPDWHQILGAPESVDNFYNLVGGSGHGFKEAAGIAESAAQTILGEKPNIDLSPYRLERFQENDELIGKYGVEWMA